jgi:hypothetical protein
MIHDAFKSGVYYRSTVLTFNLQWFNLPSMLLGDSRTETGLGMTRTKVLFSQNVAGNIGRKV